MGGGAALQYFHVIAIPGLATYYNKLFRFALQLLSSVLLLKPKMKIIRDYDVMAEGSDSLCVH